VFFINSFGCHQPDQQDKPKSSPPLDPCVERRPPLWWMWRVARGPGSGSWMAARICGKYNDDSIGFSQREIWTQNQESLFDPISRSKPLPSGCKYLTRTISDGKPVPPLSFAIFESANTFHPTSTPFFFVPVGFGDETRGSGMDPQRRRAPRHPHEVQARLLVQGLRVTPHPPNRRTDAGTVAPPTAFTMLFLFPFL